MLKIASVDLSRSNFSIARTNWSIFHPQKMIERQCENVECVGKKISRKKLDFSVQCGVSLHPEGSYTRYHTLKHY